VRRPVRPEHDDARGGRGEPGVQVSEPAEVAPPEAPSGRHLATLSLAALGVVYGDIGTSPLYAIRECFHGEYGVVVSRANVLGVLSLIVWSLILVVSIKYLAFVMRADNRGEGGILALMALVVPGQLPVRGRRWWLAVLGIFGAALLYGDGMITPSISVLSAMEGLEVATPALAPYVVPATLVILVGLFSVQRLGTARVGALFGPVTLIWFLVLAGFGARAIVREPSVLEAMNPGFAVTFFAHNGWHGPLVLAAVFLVVTGTEALYADMGHFGRRPIRWVWFGLVLPALLLNYFGQGALLLETPAAAHNPFYRLAPPWALYPLVGLATLATIIASQAVISGAFSLTRQAVQLGYSPRLPITHTSPEEIGQIYIGPINWFLMLACCGLVLGFGSSSNLAAAYGMAVTTTMVVTSVLFYVLARTRWGWGRLPAGSLVAGFLAVDLAFFGANIIKVEHGGWFPLVAAAFVFTLMLTWKRGRQVLGRRLRASLLPLDRFLDDLASGNVPRVPGTAVFLTGDPEGTPQAQPHRARARRAAHGRDHGHPGGAAGGPPDAGAAEPGLRARDRALRVHAEPERAPPDRPGELARAPPRSAPVHLLPGPGEADPGGEVGDGALARATLRLPLAERLRRHRVLPHPLQPRGGARRPDRALAARSPLRGESSTATRVPLRGIRADGGPSARAGKSPRSSSTIVARGSSSVSGTRILSSPMGSGLRSARSRAEMRSRWARGSPLARCLTPRTRRTGIPRTTTSS
jgi:KUP system potassium uptake protein